MPPVPPRSITTRKRTRSTNISDANFDHQHTTSLNFIPTAPNPFHSRSTSTIPVNAPPKRHRNNPPPIPPSITGVPPPVTPRTTYSLRNRSLTPDPRHSSTRFPTVNAPPSRLNSRTRYNLRPRNVPMQPQAPLPQISTSNPVIPARRSRPPIPPIVQTPILSSSNVVQTTSLPNRISTATIPVPPPLPTVPPLNVAAPPVLIATPQTPVPIIQPRQYRLVYISDDDELPTAVQATATIVNTTFNLMTDDEDDEPIQSHSAHRRTSRSTSGAGLNTRSRTITAAPSSATSVSSAASSNSSSSATTINSQDFINGVAHIRLNRAIEIVIDSIQSLEGAVNNFDQLVFGLVYGRLGTRTEFETIEGMIRLSRILNLSVPSRLSQEEIDSLPKITFLHKSDTDSSILLAEKCPICLNEFNDQEIINKLHCTHLFHLQCISTWLSENDSCPTCRRKVMGD